MLEQRLHQLDRSSTQFPEQLDKLLHDRGWVRKVQLLPEDELMEVIGYLDDILDSLDRMGSPSRKCLHILQKFCSSRMVLPPTYEVSGELSLSTMEVVAYGGFCDVYRGTLGGASVCIKRLRISITGDQEMIRKALCKEAVVWKHLDHPNIVPFKGVTFEPLQLVSEWMPGGELREYIENNPHADLLGLSLGIAEGLGYLHSCNVIHGDLKGANILVDVAGNARIVDFDLSTVPRDPDSLESTIGGQSITARYTAPEVLTDNTRHTKESDVFAFGMVMTVVFTGNVPFHNSIMAAAIASIIVGERPERPAHPSFTDPLWTLTQQCWKQKPQDRPRMDQVIKQLADQVPQMTPTQSVEPPSYENPEASPPKTASYTSSIRDTAPETVMGGSGGDLRYEGAERSGPPLVLSPPPALPRVPTNCLSREEIVNEVLDLTDQIASSALFGSIGVGKTFVALTLLHHNQTQGKFGRNCHFMRCDDLTNSLEAFLERLSDTINTNHTTNTAQLRPHLESSPSLILLLDGVDLILDPLAPEAGEISAAIEELGSFEHVCLITTSRMDPDIPGFHRVEVPTLSEDGAREAFYGLCNLGRSSIVDNLIARLDFHPLSIDLLASSVRENGWDEPALLKAWDDSQTSVLKKKYHQSLKGAMELSFRSPTIQSLGTAARNVLEAVAAHPGGIGEHRLRNTFAGTTEVGAAVEVLCKFSLIYRQDGFVKMLSPFRLYFLESALTLAQHVEVFPLDARCIPARGLPPMYTRGRLVQLPTTPRRNASSREDWIRRFQSLKRKLLALIGRPGVLTNLDDAEGNPANAPSVPSAQQSPSVQVAYEI